MKIQPIFSGAVALMLAACSGASEYAMPADQATTMLSNLGSSPEASTLPAALSPVRVSFESLPDGKGVHWVFRNDDGEALGTIVAHVQPDGVSKSTVSVSYTEPETPITSHTGKQYRTQLESNIRRLIAEAVDATLDGRPFDKSVRQQVELATMKEGFAGMINEADRRMDQYSTPSPDERYSYDTGRESGPPPQPADATKPATDLSQFR